MKRTRFFDLTRAHELRAHFKHAHQLLNFVPIALQAAADNSELGKQQAETKATQVATKAAIVGVLEKAVSSGSGFSSVPLEEEDLEEID
jgi:hypothetical protein